MFYKDECFGPGIAQLLGLIADTGSIRKACLRMGMAYSKAWKIIRDAESDLGLKLLQTTTGGSHGGSSKLTQEGEDFLKNYTAFCKDCDDLISAAFKKHFGNARRE